MAHTTLVPKLAGVALQWFSRRPWRPDGAGGAGAGTDTLRAQAEGVAGGLARVVGHLEGPRGAGARARRQVGA